MTQFHQWLCGERATFEMIADGFEQRRLGLELGVNTEEQGARRFFQRFAPGTFEGMVFRNRGVVSFADEALEQGECAFLQRFAEMIPATIQQIFFDTKRC